MSNYNKEWVDYYEYLESLRQTGLINMYGARPYLTKYMELDDDPPNASTVLSSWMNNYDALVEDGIIIRE